MSVINTIRGTARKTLTEGKKQYPYGMSRQEYIGLKEQVEKEIEMTTDRETHIDEGSSQAFKDAVKVLMGRGLSYEDAAAKVRARGISEALGTMANIKKSSKDAYDRSKNSNTKPGDAPAWLKKAIKDRASKKMQKEEVEQVDELSKSTMKSYVKKALDTSSEKSVSNLASRGGYEMGKAPDDDYEAGQKHDRKSVVRSQGVQRAVNKLTKEEAELEEGRGRPPKEGSAAWHKAQAAKSGDEGETQEADKNIHTQLHKVISAKKPVTFNNGKTHEISSAHAHKALALLQNSKASERLALQHSLAHSHDRFHETIKSGKAITEPAKPKITLAKRVAESIKEATKTGDVATTVIQKIDTTNMAADSMKKYQKDPLFSKVKLKLPPTQGNKPIGGEEQVQVGKFSMAEERTLNRLYESLSEENKELFNNIVKTEEGVASLIVFATEQGY